MTRVLKNLKNLSDGMTYFFEHKASNLRLFTFCYEQARTELGLLGRISNF